MRSSKERSLLQQEGVRNISLIKELETENKRLAQECVDMLSDDIKQKHNQQLTCWGLKIE